MAWPSPLPSAIADAAERAGIESVRYLARKPGLRGRARRRETMMTDRQKDSDRGKRAGFDRRTGEVSGSGSGIANPGADEDYDDDQGIGSGSDRKEGDPSNAA